MRSVRRKRPEQVVRLTAGERRFLAGLVRRGGRQGVALRAAALLLSAEGQSAAQVGKALGVTPRAVHSWRRRWREEGVQALEARAHPGRPSRLTPAAVELLLKDVESDPREQGYAFARWTCARLAAHLEQQVGVRVSPAWVGEVLRRHGFAWRRTKLTLKGLAGLQVGRTLRAVVRGRGEVRPVALGALRLAPPGRASSPLWATVRNNHIHHFIKPGDDSHGVAVVGPARNIVIRDNDIHQADAGGGWPDGAARNRCCFDQVPPVIARSC